MQARKQCISTTARKAYSEALLAEAHHPRREVHRARFCKLHQATRGAHLVVADPLCAGVVAAVEVLLCREDPNLVVKCGIVKRWT